MQLTPLDPSRGIYATGPEYIHAILVENADYDPDIFRLALGRILARAAFDRVVTYHVETNLISPTSCAQNLFTILKSVADGCVFTKLRT